jgi:sugar lactone lactonase YvrE
MDGNVWCSVGWGDLNENGVRGYNAGGDLLGKIHIPETVANLCFGGTFRNRLYICGSTSLYAVYTSATGALEALTLTVSSSSEEAGARSVRPPSRLGEPPRGRRPQ